MKYKARVLVRHVADVVLDHLHMCKLELFALAKANEDLGILRISELQSRLVISRPPGARYKKE